MNESWDRLDKWLDEDPEINSVEISRGHMARWAILLRQACPPDDDNLLSECVIADVESATLEGAIEAALLVAGEGRTP